MIGREQRTARRADPFGEAARSDDNANDVDQEREIRDEERSGGREVPFGRGGGPGSAEDRRGHATDEDDRRHHLKQLRQAEQRDQVEERTEGEREPGNEKQQRLSVKTQWRPVVRRRSHSQAPIASSTR